MYQRAGVVFPQRSESSAPIFTPPQSHPLTYPQSAHSPGYRQEVPESSMRSDFPTLRYISGGPSNIFEAIFFEVQLFNMFYLVE